VILLRQQNIQKPHIKNITTGLAISILLLFVISFYNSIAFGEIFLHDALPHYGHVMTLTALTQEDFMPSPIIADEEPSEVKPAWDVIVTMEGGVPVFGLVGLDDVGVDFSTHYENPLVVWDSLNPRLLSPIHLENLRDPLFLRDSMYTVNTLTLFEPETFNADEFMAVDLRVNPQNLAGNDPVVMVFHTHSTEMFADSDPNDMFTGIVGIGAYLTKLLNERGIPTMHYYTERFDIVDGKPQILGSYERQESYIRQILKDNPTIEVIIDLHRDGLLESTPLPITTINGQSTARLMFVHGLSLRNVNGVAVPITNLPNPNLPTNLAFSFQMQMALNQSHPTLNRRIFLNAFRYSLHYLPKSLFVEVGDQRSTFTQAKNAMYPLADALNFVLK
jgi:stage II sporulation protein P